MDEPHAGDGVDQEPRAGEAPDRLRAAAEEERKRRRWEETYGRGGGAPFAGEDWRRSMGRPGVLPGGADWRVALRAYVAGHDRGCDTEHKLADAIRVTAEESRPEGGFEDDTEAGEAPEGVLESLSTPRRVPVADRLDFHRGPGTWRRRLALRGSGARGAGDDGGSS